MDRGTAARITIALAGAVMTRLEQVSHWAGIFGNVIVGGGLIATIYFSCQTLNEVRIDRELRADEQQEPFRHEQQLAEKQQLIDDRPMVFVQHEFAQAKFMVAPNGRLEYADKNLETSTVPKIKNYGRGAALGIKLYWKPKSIEPQELADADPDLLREAEGWPVPDSLASSDTSKLFVLPRCFDSLLAGKIVSVAGDLEIRCTSNQGRSRNHSSFI